MDMPAPKLAILGRKPAIVAALRDVLPADAVIDAPEETRAYECDALSAYACAPLAVTLPRSTAEVAAVLRSATPWACRWCRVGRAPRWPGGPCRPPTAWFWALAG